jgi:hypothetical protein
MSGYLNPGLTDTYEWVNGRMWRHVAVRLHGVRFAAERDCFVAGPSEDLDV